MNARKICLILSDHFTYFKKFDATYNIILKFSDNEILAVKGNKFEILDHIQFALKYIGQNQVLEEWKHLNGIPII